MSTTKQAALICKEGQAPQLLGVSANGSVTGRLLAMALQQRYRNAGSTNVEIVYTFALPFGAVLMEVEVDLNGKALQGVVSAKAQARERYEAALSEGDSGVMLERHKDGSYTLEIGNLLAGETCSILVRYAQVLTTAHGQVRLMLPTTIAPRYGDAVRDAGLQPHQVSATDITAEYPFDITLALQGDLAHASVASPSHRTSYTHAPDALHIGLAQHGFLDRDFVLVISGLTNDSDGLLCADPYQDGQSAAMAFFSPRIPAHGNGALSAKVLVDCSGSMAGTSIEAARSALTGIIGGLQRDDRFTLSRFGSTVAHRNTGFWHGSAQAKASAQRWVDQLEADMGGTEMQDALTSTIALAGGVHSDILLVTDGDVHAIDAVIATTQQSGHRVFIVAIGTSPAESHLRRLAHATGGLCDFVAADEGVGPAVLRMFARLRSRRASQLRIDWPPQLQVRWQQPVQDFAFDDDAFDVSAWCATPAPTGEPMTAKLWGRVQGLDQEVLLAEAALTPLTPSTCATPATPTSDIPARITAWAQCSALRGTPAEHSTKEARSAATALAVHYKLVTPDTNFVLIHVRPDADKPAEMPELRKVAHMLAAGWGGTAAKVAPRADIPPSSGKRSTRPRSVSISASASARPTRRPRAAVASTPAALPTRIDRSDPLQWCAAESSPDGYTGVTPAGLAAWLLRNAEQFHPRRYADLRALGLGLAVCEWLEFEVGAHYAAIRVVKTFLQFIRAMDLTAQTTFSFAHDSASDPLTQEIGMALRGTSSRQWPVALVRFPALEDVV